MEMLLPTDACLNPTPHSSDCHPELDIASLLGEGARALRLSVGWRLRVHFEVPVRVPRPPMSARRRVLLVMLCVVRLYLPIEIALCVLEMCTLWDLCV